MIADYYRYMAESATGDKLQEVSDLALSNYEKAHEEGAGLEDYSPIKLGLALNMSVFHFEVRDNKEDAIEIAEKAYKKATADIDAIDEEVYRDSTGIIDLLKENLELWKEDDNADA